MSGFALIPDSLITFTSVSIGIPLPLSSMMIATFFDSPYSLTVFSASIIGCKIGGDGPPLVHHDARAFDHRSPIDPLLGKIDGVSANLRIRRTRADRAAIVIWLDVQFQRHVDHPRVRLLQAPEELLEIRWLHRQKMELLHFYIVKMVLMREEIRNVHDVNRSRWHRLAPIPCFAQAGKIDHCAHPLQLGHGDNVLRQSHRLPTDGSGCSGNRANQKISTFQKSPPVAVFNGVFRTIRLVAQANVTSNPQSDFRIDDRSYSIACESHKFLSFRREE